jgi:chromosome partitioning protein
VLRGEKDIRETVVSHSFYKFVPAGINLSGAEIEFSNMAGRECILKEAVEVIQDQYEYILIDCPPSLSLLTLNALVASGEIFITLQTEFLAMEGMNQLLDTVDLVRKRLNPSLQISGIVANQYDSRKGLHKEVLRTIQIHFSDKLFKTPIRDFIAIAEAGSFGMDIFEYKPKSNAVHDYSELAAEIINQEQKICPGRSSEV